MNLKKFIETLNDIKLKNNTIVIAVSTGIDSMSLFHALLKYKDDFNIVCAHINHNVRNESNEEEKFLEKFCKENNCIFETIKLEKIKSGNFHHEARKFRYNFFESLLKKYNSNILLTAHHADDLMETILMRLIRGSSLKGYSGFDYVTFTDKNYYIIRPFINYTKDEIINYATLNNIEYRIDSSNEKDLYSRNRIRKNVIPFLKNENENIHERFIKFNNLLSKYDDTIKHYAKDSVLFFKEFNYLNIEDIKKLPEIVVFEIIHEILKIKFLDDINLLNDKHTEAIRKMIIENQNKSIDLPNNVTIISEYNKLFFKNELNEYDDFKIKLNLDEKIIYNQFTITLTNDKINFGNNYYINSCEVDLPLYVRTFQNGDKIILNEGSKKVNRVFIDKKISKLDRLIYPIIVDSNDKIIAIVNLKKSKYCKPKHENYDIIVKYEQGGNV